MSDNTVKNEMIEMFQGHADMQRKLLDGLKWDYENDVFSNLKEVDPEQYKKSRDDLLSQIKELEGRIDKDNKRDSKMAEFLKRDNVTVTI